jgi:asparagine synthetase B (glutamine-hydrolysing)
MPGVSVIYGKGLDQRLISKSLDDLKHEPNYEALRLFGNNNFTLAFTGYEGYPRQYFEDEDTAVFIEGLIYNISDSQVEQSLKALSRSYIENGDFKNAIKEFIDSSDGDFVVVVYFKRLDEFIVFNDRWGRLPSYYYHDDKYLHVNLPSFCSLSR